VEKAGKILIILDNFSGHAINSKTDIEFLFLPPTCISHIKPLDMGIIMSFKSKYNKYLNNFFISMKWNIRNL
jgi:hypothetical protein